MAKSIQDRLKHLEQTFRGCCNELYKLITRVEDLEANTTAALLLKEDTANKSTSTSDSSSNTKFPVWSAVVSYVTSLGYQTASMVSSAISSALASFKTANYLDATSSIQTQLDSKEKVANKATDLLSPDNTKYPTTLAVVNENKKATITVELISQLTTNFYAPNALKISGKLTY